MTKPKKNITNPKERFTIRKERLVEAGRRALLRAAIDRKDGTATADDVRAAVELPPGINAKTFGGVPGPLAKAEIIRRVGYVQTARDAAHARAVSIWQLTDRRAARAWLRAHPEPPADDPNQGKEANES